LFKVIDAITSKLTFALPSMINSDYWQKEYIRTSGGGIIGLGATHE
jgi:hypothetical protein